jgi:hypothetical protein
MPTLQRSLRRLLLVPAVVAAILAASTVESAAAAPPSAPPSGTKFTLAIESVAVDGTGVVTRSRTLRPLAPGASGAVGAATPSVQAPPTRSLPAPARPRAVRAEPSDCTSSDLYYQIINNNNALVVQWAFHYTWCWGFASPGDVNTSISYYSASADPPQIYDTYWQQSGSLQRSDSTGTFGGLPGVSVRYSGVQFSYCYAFPFNLCFYFNPIIIADMAVQGLFIYNRSVI